MQTMEEGSFNRNDLFKKAMNKDWVSVIEAYKNNRSVRRAKLTRTEHTILHLAVLHKDDNVVEQLVNAIEDDEASEILKLKSNLGDTPLHVAAALGLTKTCVLLAKKWAMLVVIVRNNVGETPLYVAVHHGKKDAFFVLQDYIPTSLMSDDLSFCRRADGNTILHAAIHGIYFDLAIEIIKLYPRLVNFNNDMGQSPLHLLANKPLVFKSGNPPPDIVKKHLHSCIIVDRLVPKYHLNEWRNEPEIKRPHNYARFGIKLALTKTFRILLPEVFWLAERFTMRRQSSMDNNQDGLHATLSEDQERDEEYGRPVRSAKPRFKILMDHPITTVVANFISLRIMGIVWIVGIVGIVVIRYLMVPRWMGIPRFEILMDFPITIVVANFISLRIMGIVWIVRIMGNVVIKFLKDRRWKVVDLRTMEEGDFNRNELFTDVMKKNWDIVVEAYRYNPSVRRAKVTQTEQTVLHLAVLQKDDGVVEQLVNTINYNEACDILALENIFGDTPLHVASALGLARICWLLAEKCKELVVRTRNNLRETPLYAAVHHGKKEAFFVLQDYVPTSLISDDLSFCRRGDGNTILHAAVHGTYFGIKVDRLEPKYQAGSMSHRIRMEGNVPPIFTRDSPTEPRCLNTVINFLKTVKIDAKHRCGEFNQ